MLQKAEGLVLRTVDYGETNKIVTLFTREMGKVALFASGAKKTRSRLAATTQPFTYGSYLFFIGKGLGSIRQGEIIDSFRTLRNDLFRTAYAAYVAELMDKLTDDRSPNPFLFELLYQTLHYIDEEVDPEVMTFIFEVKMLEVAGIRPKLNGCVQCKNQDGPFVFSIREGGLLCSRCRTIDPHHIPISEASLKLLRLFTQINLSRLGKVSVKPETKRELKNVLSSYYEEYSGVKLKSRRFLDQLEKLEPDSS
ncbi:MAG TPA: DNA repair protein RecO [Bacillales bacterium]|nr:DNA repair protein RecO [Bacillales bacterium]